MRESLMTVIKLMAKNSIHSSLSGNYFFYKTSTLRVFSGHISVIAVYFLLAASGCFIFRLYFFLLQVYKEKLHLIAPQGGKDE